MFDHLRGQFPRPFQFGSESFDERKRHAVRILTLPARPDAAVQRYDEAATISEKYWPNGKVNSYRVNLRSLVTSTLRRISALSVAGKLRVSPNAVRNSTVVA